MILTTEERPIWRVAYRDCDDDGARVVLYTDYLEIADGLLVMGATLMNMGVVNGVIQWAGDGSSDRTVVPADLLCADHSVHHLQIWREQEMDHCSEHGDMYDVTCRECARVDPML